MKKQKRGLICYDCGNVWKYDCQKYLSKYERVINYLEGKSSSVSLEGVSCPSCDSKNIGCCTNTRYPSHV